MRSAPADAVDTLGDFTATRRMLLVAPLAIVIGLVGAFLAKGLLALIALATNVFFSAGSRRRLSLRPMRISAHS